MRLLAPMTLIVVFLLAFFLLAGVAIILRSGRGQLPSSGTCTKCGAHFRPLARYCSHCGAKIGADT